MLKIWAKTLVKIRQNLLDHAKQSAKDAFETATKRAIQKTAEATGDLMINKVANDIPKKSPQNTSETVESETEMLKKRYIYAEERQQIIDELRLI